MTENALKVAIILTENQSRSFITILFVLYLYSRLRLNTIILLPFSHDRKDVNEKVSSKKLFIDTQLQDNKIHYNKMFTCM
jgi:hypothetical protein